MLRRMRLAAVFYLLAALALLCGCGFLIGAAFVVAAERWGAAAAALGFAIGFLVLAAIIFGCGKLLLHRRTRRRKRQRASDARLLAQTAALTLLPLLSRGGARSLLLPLAALASYAIYRENRRSAAPEGDGED